MNIDQQKDFYNDYWKHDKKLNSLVLRRAVSILSYFTLIKRQIPNPKIIDLGCGEGRLTAFLGEFGEAEGLELSSKAVNLANKLYPHVDFQQADILNFTINKNYYDVVISQEVIEHIEDQSAYLEKCCSALKQGGYLILTTPNKKVLDAIEESQAWSNQPIEKVLTPKALKILVEYNFEVIEFNSIIFNFGDKGYFKVINHRYIIGIFNILGLKLFREYILGRVGLGLHLCVFAQKK